MAKKIKESTKHEIKGILVTIDNETNKKVIIPVTNITYKISKKSNLKIAKVECDVKIINQ